MAELKTKPTDQSVEDFLNKVAPEQKRLDSFEILGMMKKITGEKPVMWGESIVGFGSYHYKGASGREGDWLLTGFSPRKQNLTLYLIAGLADNQDMLRKLGKHKTSVGCLYLKRLADVDKEVLADLIKKSVEQMKQKNR